MEVPEGSEQMQNRKNSNHSITAMKGADRIRMRPAVIFESSDAAGCENMITKLLTYCVQDHQLGYVSEISLEKQAAGSFVLTANGTGISMSYYEDLGYFDWEEAFCGTFPKHTIEHYHEMNEKTLTAERERRLSTATGYPVFTFGLDLFAGTAASSFMDAESRLDGILYTLHFVEGNLSGDISQSECSLGKNGMTLYFLPDPKVCSSTEIEMDHIAGYAAQQAALNPGLKITVSDQAFCTTHVYQYPNGLAGRLAALIGNHKGREISWLKWSDQVDDEIDPIYALDDNYDSILVGTERHKPYSVSFEVAFAPSAGKEIREFYCNHRACTDGGVLRSAVENAILSVDVFSPEIIIHIVTEDPQWMDEQYSGIKNDGIYRRLYNTLKTGFLQQHIGG